MNSKLNLLAPSSNDVRGWGGFHEQFHPYPLCGIANHHGFAVQIRERNRAEYRLEVGQPGMKWRIFQEQSKKGEREMACMERRVREKRTKVPKVVDNILQRLRYLTDRNVKQKGGRARANLRKLLIHWDRESSGMLNIENLIGALSQFGVPIARREAEEVMDHYATKGDAAKGRELSHSELLEDALKGAPGLLEGGEGVTDRLLGSSRSEGCLLGRRKPPRKDTAVIKAFRTKLQKIMEVRMRDGGGSPVRFLHHMFFCWDAERNGTASVEQLRGALRSLNMRVSSTHAEELARYYAKGDDPNGECDYMNLIRDVCGPDPGPFAIEADRKDQTNEPVLAQAAAARPRGQGSGRSSDRSSHTGEEVRFTGRPMSKPRNRVVERFKLRLRDALERIIKEKGGVPQSIIREAFLYWDVDASGRLDAGELTGALRRMGVHVTDAEANAVIHYYDKDNSGEMSYELLCKEIRPMAHPMLSYIEELDVLNGLNHSIDEPVVVASALKRIRVGVISAGRRAVGSSSALPPISPRDLLVGTCLRFDPQDRGMLGVSQLRQVWRELKISLRQSETAALMAWLDKSATHALAPSDLCNAVFGVEGNTCNRSIPSFRPKEQPLPLPPKPHVLQARRAAALSMGESAAAARTGAGATTTAVAPAKRQRCPPIPPGMRRAPYFENPVTWNWQRQVEHVQAGGRSNKYGSGPTSASGAVAEGARIPWRCESADLAGVRIVRGCVRGGVLQASGESVVAERSRIERRLKELQEERANLLRAKTGVTC